MADPNDPNDPKSPNYDPRRNERTRQAQDQNEPRAQENRNKQQGRRESRAATKQQMPNGHKGPELEIPNSRQEFKFDGDVQAVPGWVDKGWAGYDRGPAIHVPQGPAIRDEGPYTTHTARIGDTIVFVPNEGAVPAHYEVLKGDLKPDEGGTKKPPQASAASLEDMLRTGVISPDELGDDAAAQVEARSPNMKRLLDGDMPAPEPQEVPIKV